MPKIIDLLVVLENRRRHLRSEIFELQNKMVFFKRLCEAHEMSRPPIYEKSLSPAERKRRQYQKDRRAIIDAIGNEDTAPDKALLALMKDVAKSEHAANSAQRAWREFGKRHGWLD
ncbi:hypothetical protein [Acidithiobacillus ferriphilus]|uniref:hypothetical protein n=1 Tax=Acidithiobacillus ferriphilus TaxID=1689834 RepID=UPI00232F1C3F|nr:hypothetical protein [Acidithiobacillus ferriphilus]WCE95289.1 hypothetical protein PJU76_13605 [Acidithiobacillus ferriphilus]